MFGLSGEHLILLVGVLLIFGPKKLPQLGAALGKTARNIKEQMNGIMEPSYKRLGETIEAPDAAKDGQSPGQGPQAAKDPL